MLIKEESFRIRQTNIPSTGSRRKPPLQQQVSPSHRLWQTFLFGLLVLILSTALTGLMQVKSQLVGTYQEKFESFRWIVMVKGDQLQSDEVGRYLKQLSGVSAVTYSSSLDAFQVIAQNPLFSDELKDINPDFLPSSWEVQWSANEQVTVEKLREIFSEVSNFPGVMDVAYDLNQWNDIQVLNNNATRLRVVMSLCAFLGILWGLIFLGRMLFFSSLKWIGWKTFLGTALITALFWTAGFFLAQLALGPVSPLLLIGGILVGSMRGLWRCQVALKG